MGGSEYTEGSDQSKTIKPGEEPAPADPTVPSAPVPAEPAPAPTEPADPQPQKGG